MSSCSDNDSDPLNVFSERVVTLDLKPKEVRELKNRFKPLNSCLGSNEVRCSSTDF